jgi:hypothetical protein
LVKIIHFGDKKKKNLSLMKVAQTAISQFTNASKIKVTYLLHTST